MTRNFWVGPHERNARQANNSAIDGFDDFLDKNDMKRVGPIRTEVTYEVKNGVWVCEVSAQTIDVSTVKKVRRRK